MEKNTGPINSIVLARASNSDRIYKKDQTSIDKNGLCELMISENQFMNFNDRADYLQGLADKLFGVEYYLNDFVSTGIMYYDLLDMYNVEIFGKTYNCLMLNNEQDITQGLEENIHTDRPEKSETDYTKADKTDRKINQTNLIVDKQNQKIEGVISQIGDRSEKTTTITADIDGLNSRVSQIEDITDEKNGVQSVILENCAEGELLELHIYGNNTVFKYNTLGDSLILGDNLILGNKTYSIIIVQNQEGENTNYNLNIPDVLRQNGTTKDEYIIQNGKATIIRRINTDGSIKSVPTTEELGAIAIKLSSGNNTVSIKDFSAEMKIKYVIKNDLTDILATRVELNSSIQQTSKQINMSVNKKLENYSTTEEMNASINVTAEGINQKVNKKVGNDEIISKINQSAEAVGINANKIELSANDILNLLAGNTINLSSKNIIISSNVFNVASNGKVTIKGTNQATDLLRIENINSSDFAYYAPDSWGIVRDNGSIYATAEGGNFDNSDIELIGTGGTTNVSNTGIRTPVVTQTSIEKDKKNFEVLNNGLEIIKNTDIYKYHLKSQNDTDKKHIGFVIGDKYNYSQEITSQNNDGVDTYSMISVTYKAIQEQQELIEQLQKEIKELKGGE